MKKATPKTKRAAAPAGLRALIAALQPADYNHNYAPKVASVYAAVPEAILRAQRDGKDGYEAIVLQAADREFPDPDFGENDDEPASTVLSIVAMAGFWSGVATCWHLMNVINGRGEKGGA